MFGSSTATDPGWCRARRRAHSSSDSSAAQHSRHIDRKLYKMRELRGAGIMTVKYVPTDDNTADLFTKVLTRQPFEKHRRRVMNLTDK